MTAIEFCQAVLFADVVVSWAIRICAITRDDRSSKSARLIGATLGLGTKLWFLYMANAMTELLK